MTGRDDQDATLGEQLKKARDAAKLTQATLAERLKVDRAQVIKWEKDQHVPTKTKHRVGLIRELNLPADFFEISGHRGEVRLSRRVQALEKTVGRIERQLFGEDAAQGR